MNERLDTAKLAMLGLIMQGGYGSVDCLAEDALLQADALLVKAGDHVEPEDWVRVGSPEHIRVESIAATHWKNEARKAKAEIARLKSELERVTAPLTGSELQAAWSKWESPYTAGQDASEYEINFAQSWDRAITAVKMGRK